MSRRPSSYLVTLDGVGLNKPTAVRSKAVRSRSWWARRLGCDLDVVRLRGVTP